MADDDLANDDDVVDVMEEACDGLVTGPLFLGTGGRGSTEDEDDVLLVPTAEHTEDIDWEAVVFVDSESVVSKLSA